MLYILGEWRGSMNKVLIYTISTYYPIIFTNLRVEKHVDMYIFWEGRRSERGPYYLYTFETVWTAPSVIHRSECHSISKLLADTPNLGNLVFETSLGDATHSLLINLKSRAFWCEIHKKKIDNMFTFCSYIYFVYKNSCSKTFRNNNIFWRHESQGRTWWMNSHDAMIYVEPTTGKGRLPTV